MNTVRRCSGISLIEMMVSLTILAVVALALANSMIVSMNSTGVTDEREGAIRTARERLERAVAIKRALINTATSYPNSSNNNAPPSPAQQAWPQAIIDTATDYGVITSIVYTAGSVGVPYTFPVTYTRHLSGSQTTQNTLPAINATVPLDPSNKPLIGEIVAMFDETVLPRPGVPYPYPYGRFLTGVGGTPPSPDGVTFVPIGDMDMDGLATNNDVRPTIWSNTNNAGCMPLGAIVRWMGSDGKEQRVEMWTVVDFYVFNTVPYSSN